MSDLAEMTDRAFCELAEAVDQERWRRYHIRHPAPEEDIERVAAVLYEARSREGIEQPARRA